MTTGYSELLNNGTIASAGDWDKISSICLSDEM